MGYTLGEAAKATGKSKATLSKAVKSGRLSATRLEDGSFSIEPVELHRVYPILSETLTGKREETPEETVPNGENPLRIRELEVRLEVMQERLDEVREDRDKWRVQAQSLLPVLGQPAPPKGFWRRVFS